MSDRSFVKVDAKRAANSARSYRAALESAQRVKLEKLKSQLKANREWWRRWNPWLRPLSDDEAARRSVEVGVGGFPVYSSIFDGLCDIRRCETILVLCGQSADGFVFLDEEHARIVERYK